jgi:hypothetical protein
MAEVLIYFDATTVARDGSRWTPRACGGRADDGLWEGWIDFVSTDGSSRSLRSPRETEQPDRANLMYWATGLTQVYLAGALERAIARTAPSSRQPDATP